MTSKNKEERIILMSKLALYEKHYGKLDQELNHYFKHDYVFIQNMWMRFYICLGGLFVFGCYMILRVFSEGMEFIFQDFTGVVVSAATVLIAILLVYSLVGTLKYGLEYDKSHKRLNKYLDLLDKLDALKEACELEGNEVGMAEDATENS